MKNLIVMIALALSAVAASLGYNMKNENKMSELGEANIEALNQQEEIEGCIIQHGGRCIEITVLSSGEVGWGYYKHYINYMEVVDDE